MRYHSLGRLPAKRHVQFRDDDGHLLTEEVMGYEGFSGNESILYHLHSPCRIAAVGTFAPLERPEWKPPAHVHRLAHTAGMPAGGDMVSARRLLMFNDDVELALVKPDREAAGFYRD